MSSRPTLNPEQIEAVEHRSGPLRIGACAGSGKTTTLIERVAHLVESRSIAPQHILLISFSVAAKKEMEKRLRDRLPGVDADPICRTFHSIALQILKAERPSEAHLDTTSRMWMRAIRLAFKRLGISPFEDKLKAYSSIVKSQRYIGDHAVDLKETALRVAQRFGPRESLDPNDLVSVYLAADRIRTTEGIPIDGAPAKTFFTFDDMLIEAAKALSDDEIRPRWAQRWTHVLQDEAQDESEVQAQIAEALCRDHRNYVIVGDPAQCCYSFRGAAPHRLTHFDKEWPDATTVLLKRNYRSGIEVIDAANRILGQMPADTILPLVMTSERQTHSYLVGHRYPDQQTEAKAIVANIIAHHEADLPWEEQAILVRMNAMVGPIEMALARAEVPFKMISGDSFFDLRETKALLGYLRVMRRRAGPEDFEAAVSNPTNYLTRDFFKIVHDNYNGGRDWAETLHRSLNRLRDNEYKRMAAWLDTIASFSERAAVDTPYRVLTSLMVKTGLDPWFAKGGGSTDDDSAQSNVSAVLDIAADYTTVDAMLDEIDAVESHIKSCSHLRKVVLVSTVHKAKGREWAVVYVPQAEATRFPAKGADVDEERRLFYVAITRAKDEAWLSWSDFDYGAGVPSPFITDAGITISSEFPEFGVHARPEAVGDQMRLL